MVDGACPVATAKSTRLTPVDFTLKESIRISKRRAVRGVSWDKFRQQWKAQACYQGKKYNLGRFNNIDDAIKVYRNFRKTFPDGRL